MPIIVNLDVMMAKRKIGLMELAEKMQITPANLSILKNNPHSEAFTRRRRRSAGAASLAGIAICDAPAQIAV